MNKSNFIRIFNKTKLLDKTNLLNLVCETPNSTEPYCGSTIPAKYTSEGYYVRVEFISNPAVTGSGLKYPTLAMVKLSPLFKLQHRHPRQLPHLYVGVSYLDLLERYSLLNTQTTILTMQTVFVQLTVQKENLLKWNLPTLILSTTAPASKLCTGEVECLKICGSSVGAYINTSFASIPGII